MNRAAATALAFTQHHVAGYRLEPFSAAHAVALEVCGVKADSPVQLVTALRICSRPVGADCRPNNYLSPNGLRELAVLAWLALPGRLRRVRKQFEAYLEDHLSSPQIKLPEGTTGTEVNGDPQFARVSLGMKAGLTEFRAWSMPIAWLDWQVAQYVVNEGGRLRIIDKEAEKAKIERLRKLSKNG